MMKSVLALSASLLFSLPVFPQSPAYRVSGAHEHENLKLFLLVPESHSSAARRYLPLKEAVEQKKAVVHETKNVNNLSIENLSDEEVYVQGGDILKGGEQDRVLVTDLILPPKSGRIPIAAFCVEQGRWSPRGNESPKQFMPPLAVVASKETKLAVAAESQQASVWESVKGAIAGLSAGLSAKKQKPIAVAAPESMSSYMLSIENTELMRSVEEYMKPLAKIIDSHPASTGYAFAINNVLSGAEVYSSPALFRQMWPKMLRASATEAIARYNREKKPAINAAAVLTDLSAAHGGAASEQAPNARTKILKRDSARMLLVESSDQSRPGGWVHRSYIAK